MTKTLLVNCYLKSTEIKGLEKVLAKYSVCSTVEYGDIKTDYRVGGDADAVVVSGSDARIVKPADRAKYEGVLDLIRACRVPLLGICFGHQLLCYAFKAQAGSLSQPVINRFEAVRLIQADGIFAGFEEGQTIPLAEYHNDYVLKDSLNESGFTLLADSVSCEVEAVKHNTKPFWGVQFHPERKTIKGETHPEGHKIIENFFDIVKR
jgi:GMP synthase-like glutamine amidotransferase